LAQAGSKLVLRDADLIADSRHEIVVSAATIWEIAIKHGLARKSKNVGGRPASHHGSSG
jgi:PIN domain nuclease of toxin-antitoxin system